MHVHPHAFCDNKMSRMGSGNHYRNDPVQVQSTIALSRSWKYPIDSQTQCVVPLIAAAATQRRQALRRVVMWRTALFTHARVVYLLPGTVRFSRSENLLCQVEFFARAKYRGLLGRAVHGAPCARVCVCVCVRVCACACSSRRSCSEDNTRVDLDLRWSVGPRPT